jgi:hypothetical protein
MVEAGAGATRSARSRRWSCCARRRATVRTEAAEATSVSTEEGCPAAVRTEAVATAFRTEAAGWLGGGGWRGSHDGADAVSSRRSGTDRQDIADGREAEPGRELRRAQQALTVYLGALFEMERTLYSQHSPTKHLPASRRCQRFARCRRGGR